MACAKKVVVAMKTKPMKVNKQKSVSAKLPLGKFAKTVVSLKRKSAVEATVAEQESTPKKIKSTPLDEKTLSSERKVALSAMKLAEVEKLHKSAGLVSESVKEVMTRAKDELSSKQLPDLKDLCGKKELKVGGAKADLVQRLLDYAMEDFKTNMVQALLTFESNARKLAREQEAQAREEARLHAVKVREIVSTMKKEVSSKTGDEIKQVLTNYGLKLGGSKDEKVDRIVERLREDGQVETALAALAREARKQQLLSMDAMALVELCTKAKGLFEDRLVKEILVDRLVASETKK